MRGIVNIVDPLDMVIFENDIRAEIVAYIKANRKELLTIDILEATDEIAKALKASEAMQDFTEMVAKDLANEMIKILRPSEYETENIFEHLEEVRQ